LAKAVFSKVDLLLTPVLSIPVPSIAETSGKKGKDYLDMVVALTRNTKVVNYFGVPAISAPCGFTSNRMPAAFQLIGRPLAEAALLRAVHHYQEITDWHLKEPTIVSQTPARANV
jgi:aspartyl-tRNA(Asn)/glutamyl-tRNA(Gln) amidotransferase subunit A